jgi:VanZ family protein
MRWELAVLLAGTLAITIGCLTPQHRMPALPNDKALHFLAFGLMALMAGRLADTGVQAGFALGAVFVASWLIEVLQNLVPGRKFCWRDMAANAAGVLSAGVFLAAFPSA